MQFQNLNAADGCIYSAAMPVLPRHRRTGNGECHGDTGGQVAPETTCGASETVEAAQGNSEFSGDNSREEETAGDDSAREGRAAGPASERRGRSVAVAGRGEDADDRAAETTEETR